MKRVVWGRAVGAVLGLVCVLAAPAGIGMAVAQAAPAEPIVLIVLENKTSNQIVGSKDAPYIQSLIAAGSLYTNYQAAPGSLVTIVDGNVVLGVVAVDSSGNWQFTPTLSKGKHSIMTEATNAAGYTSLLSGALNLNV